ncbi:DUF6385 domain-containing protein [Sporomusa acidovorans]|uniref:DUF6385 domain-containing protein n=1 Tax=Sporomusa acidovorans TaxID=112900 RepID=UPI0024AFD534|nr:DUF6385 domain-containing protein [Sporomusa acidovorans]
MPICPTVTIPVSVALSTTDVVFGPITNIGGGGPGAQAQVLSLGQWTYGIVNNSATGNNAQAYLQVSPDATNWIQDGATISLAYNGTGVLINSIFLKYARVYYYAEGGTASAVTLNIFLQGNAVE